MNTGATESFHTTRWTLVRHATGHSAEGKQALSELCAAYYEPVVAFLRRSGSEGELAREMAHDFFAHVLEKPDLGGAEPGRGRFRSYLLGALKHHLSHLRERAARQKRGGGLEVIPLTPGTDTSPGVDPSDVRTLPPDREFDRQWAMHVLKQAMMSLESEWRAAGKDEEFLLLHPLIAGEPEHGGLAALAEARGLNASSLRKTLSRLRQRFRHHVKAAITPTLAEGVETDDDMRQLLAALSP
jgi:DNA-directed RNA polymerase specialized sigma24 family protein